MVSFKPNAVANQRLMSQHSQQRLVDARGSQGIKSSCQLGRDHNSALNRSKSPRSGGGLMYQSTATEKILKSGGTASSLTKQHDSQRQSVHQSTRPLTQVNNFTEQRNESAGTGEQAVMPPKSILKRGSSSSSSQTHQKSIRQLAAAEENFQQKATGSAAAPLKNSRSSFQLTFSRTGNAAQSQPQQPQ